jgi:hypothetical protein
VNAGFGDPGAFAFRAFGRLAEFVVGELKIAFLARGDVDDGFILRVLERLEQVLKIFDRVFAGLIHEAGDFGDGHRAIEQHWDEIFSKHKVIR